MEYRARLYDTYVSTHVPDAQTATRETLARQRPAWHQTVGRFLPASREAAILDVGCGYGAFLDYLRAQGYRQVEGVDISPEQIAAAHRLGLTHAVCAEARGWLRERPGRYECMVAIDFLEHFPKADVLEMLEAIARGLRPGGRLIMQSPNAESPFGGRYRYGDFTHEFALTATSARQILEAAGFQDVRCYEAGPVVHGLPSLVRAVIWRSARTLLWLYLVAETGIVRGHLLTQNLIVTARTPLAESSRTKP